MECSTKSQKRTQTLQQEQAKKDSKFLVYLFYVMLYLGFHLLLPKYFLGKNIPAIICCKDIVNEYLTHPAFHKIKYEKVCS